MAFHTGRDIWMFDRFIVVRKTLAIDCLDNRFYKINFEYVLKKMLALTDVTSSGIVKTIRKEKLHAVNTDKVTRGCCLWTFP